MREWHASKSLPLMGLAETGYHELERGDYVKHGGELWVLTGADQRLGFVFIARFGKAKAVSPDECNIEWSD